MATKTSILIFYLQLAHNTQKVLRIASYVTLAIVNISGTVMTFLNIFQCRPVALAFTPSVNQAQCFSIVTLFLCSAPVNIASDLAILILPIPVLTGMRLPQKQKTILVMTFGLGVFVTIVDVVRIYYLQKAELVVEDQELLSLTQGQAADYPWNASFALMWSAVEVNIGIICGCIPTLKPLFLRILPAMLKDPSGDRTGRSNSEGSCSADVPKPPSQTLDTLSPSAQADHDIYRPPAEGDVRSGPEAGIEMMRFLTAPNMNPEMQQALTHTSRSTAPVTYFGFFDVKVPKNMLRSGRVESFKYCLAVTILFFLWGFSYGLLNNLNNEISDLAKYSWSQNIGLASIYFGAYFFGALTVGQLVLRRCGFKSTFIAGLCIYGIGTLMFWPCAVLSSYPGFLISTFVVGFGLSVLETAANPFLALCGHPHYAEFRLLLAQGVQGVATILSQILAQKAIFKRPSLLNVQWTYLAVTLLTVILLLFFYYMPLPEAKDSDLQIQADDLEIPESHKFFPRLPVIYTTLGLAILGQFCYLGVQQDVSVGFKSLLASAQGSTALALSPNNFILLGLSLFALGRFLAAFLCLAIPPRIILLIVFVCGFAFSIPTFVWHASSNKIAAPVLLIFFFEGPVYPLIFAMCLRGMGRNTKRAAAYITAAASGGAVFPFVMYGIAQEQNHANPVQYSFFIVTALYAIGSLFPIYLNFSKEARKQVDTRTR